MKTRLEDVLSRLLLVGLSLAVLLMLAGVVLAAVDVDSQLGHVSSISDWPRAVAGLEPAGFLDLGLLVLLATPVARVLGLLVGFTRRRVWFFSAISLIVLLVLVLSLVIGLRG